MKRLAVVVVVVGWLALVGWAAARPSQSSSAAAVQVAVTPLIPEPMPTARVPPELTYYRKRCWPACHYDPTWISEDPERISEEFEDPLSSGWSWFNDDEGDRSLLTGEGVLRIDVQPSSVRAKGGDLADVANVLAHPVPSRHFDVLTEVSFPAEDGFRSAGSFIEMEDGSVIVLGQGTCERADDPACVGQGVYFDALGLGCDFYGAAVEADTVCLMLRRAGNSYIGYYHVRQPGETEIPTELGWVEVGRCYSVGASPERVGLLVTNGNPGATGAAAEFELVEVVKRK